MASSDVNHLSQPCIYGDFVSSYAERKSRFMKWLSKLFKAGSGGRRGGSGGTGRQPHENMAWRTPIRSLDERSRSQREKDELEHAIALSLGEDLRGPSGHRWRRDHDEELAHLPFYPPHAPARPHQHVPPLHRPPAYPHHPPHSSQQHYPWGYKICGGCKREIRYRNYLGCMGTYFHPECFRCHACELPITENEFSLSGRDPYHKSCFKELAHPKCDVCHQFIPTNRAGLIEYRCHPFWSQKYCPAHEHDNTARCCSCERLESWDARYVPLGDGRSICLECMESCIMDTGDCQPLYHAIRDYYEGMNMKIDQQIPMLLVERQALNEAIVGEKSGLHHMPETRGLCLSEEQTVTSILRRPRIGGHQLIGMRTQPQKLTRKCEVTAILVLYGLPRLLTGAILAHELMHGWLRLEGFRNLNPEVEEGICQVLSHMWLESEVMPRSRGMPSTSAASSSSSLSSKKGGFRNLNPEVEEGICQALSHMWLESEVMPRSRGMPSTSAASSSSSSSSKKGGRSNAENKLGEFFMHQIANDASPAYGGGFRAANAAVNKYGLRRTLDHIRLTGNFPL